MENFKIENIGVDDGVREILGFFHHRISQQEKDIALINRRVAELIQNSKSSDQSTVQAFMEASNCRLDGFSASIQSLTDQMVQLTMPNQVHCIDTLTKSKNSIIELKNEVSDEISQINTEISLLKNQMIQLSLEHHQDEITNDNESDLPEKKNTKLNLKSKKNKKNKAIKNNLSTISIFDINPSTNSPKQEYLSSIEFITNEINQIKMKINNDNDISNQKFERTNKRIDEIEEKLQLLLNAQSQSNETNLINNQNNLKKVGFDFTSKNENNNEIEKNGATLGNKSTNCNSQNEIESPNTINNIPSSDSINFLTVSDLDLKNRISQKGSLGTINYNYGDKPKSFASTDKMNRNGSSPKIAQNQTPRKATAHYTIINGDCLKRPGSQMVQKRGYYKNGPQKYPL